MALVLLQLIDDDDVDKIKSTKSDEDMILETQNFRSESVEQHTQMYKLGQQTKSLPLTVDKSLPSIDIQRRHRESWMGYMLQI